MSPLSQLCKPRQSVFDRNRRDVVLDLTNLVQGRVDADSFFEENFITDGMRRLMTEAFRRFSRQSDQGVFLLSQAMGGGKTHNMINLGLLAKLPEKRAAVMGNSAEPSLGPVRVVAFSGRESDSPLGIWGAIAEQLGKKEVFNDYYSPLQAPGQSAWINLLQGEPLLILLDELPPYFRSAKSKTIGNSDLADVTTTALSNLLVAVNKDELANVCVVISDLRATAYDDGGQQLTRALVDLEREVGRSALPLEPVGLNTDDIYHILRKRIFESLPDEGAKQPVLEAYAKAVRDAKQMDITNASPEQFVAQLASSYPFHFAIKDLYARFRENPGFQQTRGLIRFMRTVVARLWESGQADQQYLIHAHDVDLNDRETLSEIQAINPTLDNAISHDIAGSGSSVAETMDRNRGAPSPDAQDALKLILISSLASVPDATLGLSPNEIVSLLCQPGRDVSKLPKDVLGVLLTRAWYLHSNREGRIYFKNVENLVAKLKTRAEGYNTESSIKQLQTFLMKSFAPQQRDCYQKLFVLVPVDEIKLDRDAVSLVITEPNAGGQLHPDLQAFFESQTYKNRVAFLTGERETMKSLLENAAELKAVESILAEMDKEKLADNDPQRVSAGEMRDQISLRLLSAARETFTKIVYPQADQLRGADFLMNFQGNAYSGEEQIRETLKAKQKFTEDIQSDTFRRKCEDRLFTQKVMAFSDIEQRAAINSKWQWHHPSALDDLRSRMILEDKWRENGGLIEKGPFPKPQTEVRVQLLKRDDDTGEATLRLTPVHADIVHYEVGPGVTTGSQQVIDLNALKTKELEVSFLAVDSSGEHETGSPAVWRNSLTLKHRLYQDGDARRCELRVVPKGEIRYTTDGSDPKQGGIYEGDFEIPEGCVLVLAVAQHGDAASELLKIEIPRVGAIEKVQIDAQAPARWNRHHEAKTTQASYDLLGRMKKFGSTAIGVRLGVIGTQWADLAFDPATALSADKIESLLDPLRQLIDDGQVSIEAETLRFEKGQDLLDWVADVRTSLKSGEVDQ